MPIKGTYDESWGLDNVRASSNTDGPTATSVGRAAPLLYVSPVQINFEIPAGTTTGDVPLSVQTGLGNTLNFFAKVADIAPGLFTANGDGRGVVAASAICVIAGSTLQTPLPVFRCGDTPGSCASVPIQLGVDTPTYLPL